MKVLGVGSPLLDALVRVEDEFLRQYVPGEKGGMEMVDAATQQGIIGKLAAPPLMVAGGSAGNTVFGLGKLGIEVAMLGKLGRDEYAQIYQQQFASVGGELGEFIVDPVEPTGVCLSMITPDAERTMRTNLGASVKLNEEDILKVNFGKYDLVYIEGYMFFSPVMPLILQRAKAAGCKVGLDLASFEVVRIFRQSLDNILKEYVDYVVANEVEAEALFPGLTPEAQLDKLKNLCEIAVVKLGSKGSIVARANEVAKVPAITVEAVDTTGAGDLWACGFLYGLIQGRPLAEAAYYGSVTGAEAVKVIGPKLAEDRWQYVKTQLK